MLNGFFVAAEFALVKFSVSQIELRAQDGNRLAKLTQSILQDLEAYLSACQLGITLASLAAGLDWGKRGGIHHSGALHALNWTCRTELAHRIALPVSFAIITVLHIVIGEQAPKVLAIAAARGPEHRCVPAAADLLLRISAVYLDSRPLSVSRWDCSA